MSQRRIINGIGVSAGIAKGLARIIVSQADYSKIKDGDILVTVLTDPSMTAIINKCAGIVCDVGGMTSHPAIISRELGVPAVVGTKVGSSAIKDGSTIEIDGTTGDIFEVN